MAEIKTWKINGSRNLRYVSYEYPGDGTYTWHLPNGIGEKESHLAAVEFNPETDDVLIVPKDSRRVWIDKDGDSPVIWPSKPTWDSDNRFWDEHGGIYIDGFSFDARRQDLVEFVQIATHRPPEPEKPVEPAKPTETRQPWKVAMDEVRSRYPDADVTFSGGWHGIQIGPRCILQPTAESAWLTAWGTIQEMESNGMAGAFRGLLEIACNEVARSVPVDCVFEVRMQR